MNSSGKISDVATKKNHMSDALVLNLILAFSGGYQDAYTYIRTKKYQDIVKMHDCFLIILLFTFGAGIGGNCSKVYNEGTIWGSAVLMVICFALMAIDTNE